MKYFVLVNGISLIKYELLTKFYSSTENLMFTGDIEMNTQQLSELRQNLEQLKSDYIQIVGGKDIPIYFGKLQ